MAEKADCNYITADKELKQIIKDNIPKLIPVDTQEVNDLIKFDEISADLSDLR